MKTIFIFSFCLMFIATSVYSEDFTFTGAKKCKMCHKGEKKGNVYEKWEGSPHAKAFETLKTKGEEKNPKCLECHVTGFNSSGYKIGDAKAAEFEGVQCESCHGAGSAYKAMSIMKDKNKSIEKGLIIPTEEVCKKCHNANSPTFKGFIYAESVKKIEHKY